MISGRNRPIASTRRLSRPSARHSPSGTPIQSSSTSRHTAAASNSARRVTAICSGASPRDRERRPSVAQLTSTRSPRRRCARMAPPQPALSSSGWGATTSTRRPPDELQTSGEAPSTGRDARKPADQRPSKVPWTPRLRTFLMRLPITCIAGLAVSGAPRRRRPVDGDSVVRRPGPFTYPPSTSRTARWASPNEASVMALFAASLLATAMRPKGRRARSHGRSRTGHSLVHATSSVVGS